jgi:undecaprenol kinase
MKNRPFRQRIGFAVEGLLAAWRLERSLRTQSLVAVLALVVTIAMRPGFLWAALVVLSIALVLAMELINASLEYMIDHLHPDIAPQIKLAKDVAAGAVLLASLAAAAVGAMMIFATLSQQGSYT